MPTGIFDDTDALPVTTRSGIPYEVDIAAYKEQWIPRANKTTIIARVPTASAWDWVTDMVGRVYVADVGGTDRLRRDLPEPNPYDSQQFCTQIEMVDHGGRGVTTNEFGGNALELPYNDPSTNWPLTAWTRYRCTFEAMPFQMSSDSVADADASDGFERELSRYVIRSQKGFAKEQQLPGGAFSTIDTPSVRLLQTKFVSIVYSDVSYVWTRVPVYDFQAAVSKSANRGKINSTAFDTGESRHGGYNWGAGTLLYIGYDDTNRYYDANEDWVVDVVFSFRFRQIGWNFYLNAAGVPKEVSSNGLVGGDRPYSSFDFHELFRI